MKRFTYPKFINCKPPSAAIIDSNGIYKLPIDFKKVCHMTYIDSHGFSPAKKKNPIYDEYEELLDDSDELRFQHPGIADNTESKIRESGKLGRGIARYILSTYYGYVWFGNIQNLMEQSYKNWEVSRPSRGGNTPDWLISNGLRKFCLGEAKGTHSEIKVKSPIVDSWRKQSLNINLTNNQIKKSLKSWLIVTRFVTNKQIAKPDQLIEDPETNGERITDGEFQELNKLIVRSHLIQGLYRTSNFDLGIQIKDEFKTGKVRVLTWKSTINTLSHLTFIGRPTDTFSIPTPNSFWFDNYSELDPEAYFKINNDFNKLLNAGGYFDGMAIDILNNYRDNSYDPLNTSEIILDDYPYTSLLNDGNLIIPMAFMKPDKIIEL